jgi:hypothetical protein
MLQVLFIKQSFINWTTDVTYCWELLFWDVILVRKYVRYFGGRTWQSESKYGENELASNLCGRALGVSWIQWVSLLATGWPDTCWDTGLTSESSNFFFVHKLVTLQRKTAYHDSRLVLYMCSTMDLDLLKRIFSSWKRNRHL